MRPSRHFGTLYQSATGRLQRLRGLATTAVNRPSTQFSDINREISFVTIELHTLVANFSRAYFLSCTLKPKTRSGKRVYCKPSIKNFDDALDSAMKRCKKSVWLKRKWDRRDEPSWHLPVTLIDSCDEIGCSNYDDVQKAFSIITAPVFEHLTKFRNFYAHRNTDTIAKLANIPLYYSIIANEHPSGILRLCAYDRPQALILDWMDDLENVIDLLCN